MHQQGLTCLQAPPVKYIAPDGEISLWQACGLQIGQTLGNGQTLRSRRHAQFGIAAARHQSANAVAHLELCIRHGLGVARHDDASHFEPRNI